MKVSRGFEPRSLDSESRVLTVTPRGLLHTSMSYLLFAFSFETMIVLRCVSMRGCVCASVSMCVCVCVFVLLSMCDGLRRLCIMCVRCEHYEGLGNGLLQHRILPDLLTLPIPPSLIFYMWRDVVAMNGSLSFHSYSGGE